MAAFITSIYGLGCGRRTRTPGAVAKAQGNLDSASQPPTTTITISSSPSCSRPSRRQLCITAVTLCSAALFPLGPRHVFRANSAENRLPNGARQFSQVVSAQRQWASVTDAFADGREPDDTEWNNLRTYLRAVYAVSGDMDFLARRWEKKSRRDEGLKSISQFRKAVKDLDKPAIEHDVAAFLNGHKHVASLFDDFFNGLKEDTVGDMPAEL